MKTAFAYTEDYFSYDYGASHPLRIERLKLTRDLCKAYGLLDLQGVKIIDVAAAPEEEILRFHTQAYINVLKKASHGELPGYYNHGIGPGDNPRFDGLWEWSLLHTGASLQCALMLSSGEVRTAFNIAGGLHHAGSYRASGFCYVNDPVIAILSLLEQGKRVLYLDIDAHHGDGVQWAFYEEPRVMTVSFHQDGRTLFPGSGKAVETGRNSGKGKAINVPMLPGADDDVFWHGFGELMPLIMETFDPDIIVSQLGVDTFLEDPLANLEFTTNGFCKAIRFLRDQERPWLALGGGGYDIHKVARAWTLAWGIMNGVELPDLLPESMRGRIKGAGPDRSRLRDPEHRSVRHNMCMRYMSEIVAYIKRNVIPLSGFK
jgi:acetoin utilization protein AcuC